MVSFRGASADAMAALTDLVGGVAEASAPVVSGDLFSAARTVRYEAALRRVVTDQSDRKSTRLNSSHVSESRMPSSA